MNKIERGGLVAVLVSPGYGAGWSTWNDEHKVTLCMDADIVQAVLDNDLAKAEEIAKQKCPGIYTGGCRALEVRWVPKGSTFEINEYDGSESLHILGHRDYMVA
jgi:hypothetical protein